VAGSLFGNFLQFLLLALSGLILGRIVMSYVDPGGRNQLSRFLFSVTEPILAPVRRMLPQTGALDWSGFVVLILLGLISRVI
jgi:YggT family protein